ncbi:hypothetical protein FB45DRAFT_732539, partial [Roridomyces roridus]
MALRPLQLPVISPTSSESSAASEDSRASADTEATTPPLSPIDPISPRTSPHKSKFKTSKPVPHPPLTVPSEATLAQAVRLPLVAPSGVRVPFGVLLGQPQTPDSKPPVPRRTLVIFLRHFWCPLCQDYMVALARGEGTHLLLIAPGSHTLIRRYLASFGFPRELVTPTTEYPHSTSACMLRLGWAGWSRRQGGYVTHGVLSGVGAVVMRALRAGMPIWARGGDIGLLGGEFVPTSELPTASSSLRCTYAHRMQTTRGHAGVARVLAAAGVN